MSSSWSTTTTTMINFTKAGGIPNIDKPSIQWHNSKLLNNTLQSLPPNSLLLIEGTFYLMGGILASHLTNITIQLDGQIIFSTNIKQWPRRESDNRRLPCIELMHPTNVTLTSSTIGGGILNGRGWAWWNLPLLGYLLHAEDRPRLLNVGYSTNLLMEHWIFIDPPLWSTYFFISQNLEIRYAGVLARRTSQEDHTLEDLSAFNTDGFDVSGDNVYIHHCNIWCQDDAITVKDGSTNIRLEYINTSGIGLVIGSIGHTSVHNVTFENIYMYKPLKGIYMKFRKPYSPKVTLQITNVVVENVTMDEPIQWPVWIGPAQQADARNPCFANPCSLCWPYVPGAVCDGQKGAMFENVTLRNVVMNRPRHSPGVLLADKEYPMRRVVFENVRVRPWGKLVGNNYYEESFPLLKEYDRFALNHHFAADRHVVGLRFLVGVSLIVIMVGLYRVISRSSMAQMQKVGGVILTILVALVAIVAPKAIHVERYDDYFVCENVLDGVAIGDTWPVPSCFVDNSTIDSEEVRYYSTPPWIVSYVAMSLFFVGAGSIGLCGFYQCVVTSKSAIKEEEEASCQKDVFDHGGVYVQMDNNQLPTNPIVEMTKISEQMPPSRSLAQVSKKGYLT